jgi:hypothetical protein
MRYRARRRLSDGSRPVGRARVGRVVGRAKRPDVEHTSVLRLDPDPSPVFVDPSGTRRRRLRRLAYLLGGVVVVALLVVWLSQFAVPATPPPTNPCPPAQGAVCRP